MPAEFKGYRPKNVESLPGTIHIRRGHYYCGPCGHGLFPFDDEASDPAVLPPVPSESSACSA